MRWGVWSCVTTAREAELSIIDGDVRTGVWDTRLTQRALRIVLDNSTDLADDVLRVPLHYYRDPKITEIEESQILRDRKSVV